MRLTKIVPAAEDTYHYTLTLSGWELMEMHRLLEPHEMEILRSIEDSSLVSDQLWALALLVRRLEKEGRVVG